MSRLLTTWLSVVVAILLWALVGCDLSKKQPAPPPGHQPGEPVSYETNYFIPQDGKRIYYASKDDMLIAIQRRQEAAPKPEAPPPENPTGNPR